MVASAKVTFLHPILRLSQMNIDSYETDGVKLLVDDQKHASENEQTLQLRPKSVNFLLCGALVSTWVAFCTFPQSDDSECKSRTSSLFSATVLMANCRGKTLNWIFYDT